MTDHGPESLSEKPLLAFTFPLSLDFSREKCLAVSVTLRSDFPFITGLCGLYVESGDDGSLDAAFWERLTDASSKYEKEILSISTKSYR